MNDRNSFPLVSVIIPTYNYGEFVCHAIESVRAQDYPNVEIIVIDDGSTDNTEEILSDLSDVIYIRQDNQGLSAARNHGIRISKGKYLQFLDADDLLGRTSIRKRVEYLEKHEDAGSVICRSAFFRSRIFPEPWAFFHSEWYQPDNGFMDIALYHFNVAPPHAFLTRKSVTAHHGLLFDRSLRACEDYDFWFRLALVSGVPSMLRSCWVYYRKHSRSMSCSTLNQVLHDAELCKRILATTRTSDTWLGARSSAEYVVAMFSGATITARRLWHIDQGGFYRFLFDHLMPLRQFLASTQEMTPPTSAERLFLALSQLALAKMHYVDSALSREEYEYLILPCRQRVAAIRASVSCGLDGLTFRMQMRYWKAALGYVLVTKLCRGKNFQSKTPRI